MFKLESYLTPLILNYVNKYIKNLKPEDSQFSLWGGDAVFSNLDLRLDVLEQELQLPFTFVNGHIHELRIHVPWTKLGSEPVIITINTIECILKLCGDDSGPECDSQKIIQSKRSYSSRHIKKPELAEAPPGYVQSLINRVISNICIICNNLILKYVEDDVVLSLNIKSVELLNVNEKWERAFVDTNMTDIVVRKVIHMQDLTVCLDKRDASGKIETYQDPLLYRCSTTWRLYSLYNSPHSKYPTLTRVHMYCENLEFSLTDQQLPMFLRLLYLCVALQNRGTLRDKEISDSSDEVPEIRVNIPEETTDSVDVPFEEESWGSWAWSFVPEVPIWNTTGSEEQEREANMLMAKKIFQFGIFIGKASCTLKQTVITQENIFCGSPKCVFVPLMILHFYGCSMEFTCKGKDFLNVQAGVSGATVTGLEDCVCGYQDFSASDNERRVFLKSGVPPSSGHAYSYLSSSLFDPLAPENCGQTRKYCFNHDEHFATLTEEVMVQRFPAFAFDYLYELEIPDEWFDRLSTVTTLFLEESNWHENSICRLVFGPLCIDVTSSFVHRLSKLVSSVKDYDYPSYTQSRKLSVRNSELDEDVVEQLEEFVPSRQYHLTLFKPVIRLFVADHSSSIKQEARKSKKKRIKPPKITKVNECQFYLEIYADCVDLQASVPMYPIRLVAIAISHPSQVLLHHCYNSNSVKLFGLEMSLQKEGESILSEFNIIQRASLTFFMKSLMLPEKWTNHNDLTQKEYSLECTNISLQLCEVRFLAAISIYHSWTIKYLNTIGLQKLRAAVLNSEAGPEKIFGEICDIRCSFHQSDKISFARGSVASISVEFKNQENLSILFHAPELTQNVHNATNFKEEIVDSSDEERKKSNFIQLVLQLPEEMDSKLPPLFVLHISGSTFCLEPAFLSWLSLTSFPHFNLASHVDDEIFYSSPTDLEEGSTCSSMTQDASVSQTLTKSQSTVLATNNDYEFHKRLEDILFKHSEFLSHLVLEIEIGSLCSLLPYLPWSLNHVEGSTTLQSWKNATFNGSLNQAFIVSFPLFKMRNNSSASSFDEDPWQCTFPIRSFIEEKKSQDCFPWNLQIDCFSAFAVSKDESGINIDYLLQPIEVSATIALSQKNNHNQMGLCIHMDSKFLGINFSAFQTMLLVDCLKSSSVFSTFVEKIKSWISYFHLRLPDTPESNSINPDMYIQENAFPTPTKVDVPVDNIAEDDNLTDTNSKKLTLWSQLTLSKLSIVLFGKLLPESEYENFKVHFEAEEIISSLDIQDVYSKVKVKLTSLSANCFTSSCRKQEWNPAPFDGVILFCNDMIPKTMKSTTASSTCTSQHSHVKSDNQPFLVATYTKALCSNAKEKWTAKQNSKEKLEGLEYISEIDIKVKSFDLILWMSLFDVTYQIFNPFIKLYQSAKHCSPNIFSEPKFPSGINFCSQNLPLLYIESSIIQLYLPENTVLTDSYILHNKEDGNNIKEEKSDVLMLQVDCITLTSQVENPLPRIVLDSEVYNAALNSKSLSLPGAAVEDRQYQMDISGFALGSLSGKNMLWNKNTKKDLVLHHPLTMGENPALEWNIGVIPENRNITNDSVRISPIVSPLNIRVSVAPAIVCENPCKNDVQGKVIVAGISVEVSVTSDICLYLSINQSCFIYSLLKTNLKFLFDILCNDQSRQSITTSLSQSLEEDSFEKQDLEEFPFVIPSCFTHISTSTCIQSCEIEKVDEFDFVPFEVLVTAGTVSVMFYYHETYFASDVICCEMNEQNQSFRSISDKYQHKSFKNQGISGKTDTKKNSVHHDKNVYQPSRLHPFLCVCITEPHSYIMCRPSAQKFESSCFDLQLCGSSSDNIVEKPHESCTPVIDDFLLPYLETKPGEPNVKTGIPPSFFTVSCTDFFNYPASIKVYIERPVKFNMRAEIFDSTLSFIQCFQSELENVNLKLNNETEKNSSEEENSSIFSSELNILKFFKNVHLYSTQVVLELFPSLDNSSEKLILTAGNLNMETGIETYKDEIKSFDINLDMTGCTLQMYNSNQIWSFLQPFTFCLHVRCHLNPWFQIELRLIGESMLFNLSFHHLVKLKQFILKIQEQFQKQFERFKNIITVGKKADTFHIANVDHVETKRRRYWYDDLRKGSFQFIQACEDHDSQPKAQEIVFNRASSNHPASMTWRYPEPRALTKIEVSPVPFQCEEGKSVKDRQVLTCYLQYWNSAQQEYLNLCDFMLSETEHCCLDLPDLNSDLLAVSDKWRVLLDCKSYIDDDGILETESPCLSPLALAACMSIDSCFDPSLIPVIQVQTSFELFKVSLYNYFDKRGFTPAFHPFQYDEESPENQEFALLSFINLCFSCTKWSSKMKLSCSSGITCEVLEYRNLTMLPLISPVDIICNGSVNFDKEKGPVYDVDLVLHPCFFRITQSIMHTIAFSAYSISKDLMDAESNQSCSEYVLPNYYLICNNIQECIRFGQVDTEEYIILSPLKMHAYSWWCHKKKQMLRICFGSCRWKWSQEFSIDKSGMQAVMVDNSYTIIINVKQLTHLQKQVIIDGQLIVHSELSFPIQLKYDFTNCSLPKVKGSNSFIIKSLAPESSTPTFLLPTDQCKNFKLSITGVLDSQLWSEEVSFNDNKLIKIPWNSSYQNVWCQVTHQKLDIDSAFIAVFVCPLFVLRSNLPIPLRIDVISKNDEKYKVDLIGKGHEVKLLEGLEWDHKLKIVFHPVSEMKASLSPVMLSVCDISQISLSKFDQNINLEEMCYGMQPVQNKMWPYCFIERICQPITILDTLYPCFEIRDGFIPATAANGAYPAIKVDRSQCWTGLNTLLIDVKPYVMLVNRLQIDLYLFNETELQWILPSKSVAMPSIMHEKFRLGIKMNEEYFYSSFLTVEESCSRSNTSTVSTAFSFSLNSSQCIAQTGSINILIKMKTSENKVCLFKLKSEVQEGITVITAVPIISILNKTGKCLYLALCHLPTNAVHVRAPDQLCDSVFLSDLETSEPLLFWNEFPFHGSSASKCVDINFYIYVSIYESEGQMWSYPLCLTSSLSENNRHTLSVPIKNDTKCKTLPIAVSSHKWEGMLLLAVNNDPSPVLLLHNQTSMNIFYGESVSETEGKFIYEEYQKHKIIPMLQPDSSAHYTFPSMQEKFPLTADKIPMLCLGAMGDDDTCIWSVPFRVNIDKQFVHILGLCDFMINCRQVGHTIYLYIESVNRIELTAKEVRSRIALATNLKVPSVLSHCDTEQTKPKSYSGKKSVETKSKLSHAVSKSIAKNPCNSLVKVPFILYVNVRVVHVSFILCDEFKEINKSSEVLRLNIDNAIFISRPKTDSMYYRLQEAVLCFEHIQIDNQMDNENNVVYDFPVVLQRHVNSNAQNCELPDNNIFLPNKVKENSVFILNAIIELPFLDCNGIAVQSLNVTLLPISLCIEDTFYYRVVNLAKSYAPMQFHKHASPWCDIYFPKDVLDMFPTFLNPVHFQELKINIPEITLSLHASLKLYLSLENSVLKFQPFEKEDLFTSSYEIGHAFILHYLTGALFRAGWVVGSLDLLGNPAGFARAVGAGMSDFVYLPYKGLFRGPRAFISGLSSGAMSLFTQISSGAIICMASLASSISRNMDFLCLDDEHLARQEILRHHLPQGVSEGLIQGLSGLGLSLLSAVAGIADHPLQALMSPTSPMKTASGIVSGLGKGIVGVFTKPIGGAAELLSQTGYGLLHGAGWLTPPKRQYQPVTMALDVVSSSCLKYACKVAQCASLGEVLVSIEATYVNEDGEYEKNILLLTSEALCILTEDEITLHRTFALSEIGCKKAESDQSTLVVIPSAMYRKQIFLESCGTVDRVVEYIIKNREENSSSSQDDFAEFLSKSTSSCHVFYLYPRDRSLFMTLFTFAKSRAMGKGFFTEC